MLNIQTKASQISNLTDARYFAAMGVNWLEFNIDQGSPAYIEPNALLAIKEWVEGPKFVGQFGLHNADQIIEAIKLFSFDAVLLPNYFPTEDIEQLKDIVIIQEIVVEPDEKERLFAAIENRSAKVNYFQFDFEKNGTCWMDIKNGKAPISIEKLHEIQQSTPIFLLVDALKESDLESIHDFIPGATICLRGGEEEKVGFKSFDELDEIFDKLETLS